VGKQRLGAALVIGGIGTAVLGYAHPTLIGQGARPYAYLSVIAVGAMLIIGGVMLWRDS
jgi:hypothetical protein